MTNRLALYTAVYPGVEKYLSAWYESVMAQTDGNFDIWISVDELDISTVNTAMGAEPPATWIKAATGDTPAQIRQTAIERMIERYPAIIFADSDDVLEPVRVDSARRSLEHNDVVACAMRIIDEKGQDLRITFKPPDEAPDVAALLPRNNVFGMGNTAYRSEVLRRCLPIPAECVMVDWFLATRAWTLGARLAFDNTCGVAYRQHPANTTAVLPPFTAPQIMLATERVLNHYALVLGNIPELQPHHRDEIESSRQRAEAFYNSIANSRNRLNKYVEALNQLPPGHIWWSCVAHPQLEEIWRN